MTSGWCQTVWVANRVAEFCETDGPAKTFGQQL